MKRFLLFLLLSLGLARAADERVTLTLTITNVPVTSNTLSFTAPVSKTITWTNANTATTVLTNLAGVGPATTNLFLQIASFPIGTPRLILVWKDTNAFYLFGEVNQAILATQSGNWCTLTLTTQAVTRMTTVRVPIAGETGDTNRTNIASLLALGISDYSTNAIATNATALSNYLSLGPQTQISRGKKIFYTLGGTNEGLTNGVFEGQRITNAVGISGSVDGLTNGVITGARITNTVGLAGTVHGLTNGTYVNQYSTNAILDRPTLTNGVNYGNAFSSPGTNGTGSEQFGTGALANQDGATALGNNAKATNRYALAIGFGSRSLGEFGVAIGQSTEANEHDIIIGNGAAGSGRSIAIGSSAASDVTNGIAIGVNSLVGLTHTNSMAIGNDSSTTAKDQVRIGAASYTVSIPGLITDPSQTNSTLAGSNNITGDTSWKMVTVSTLANGNNIAAPGTNVFMRLVAGPTAAFTINGIQGGRSGRHLVLWNDTDQAMTIANESGVDPTPANRIRTMTYSDVALATNAIALLYYDDTLSRWILGPVTTTASVTGEANTGSNLGASNATTKPIFFRKNGVDFEHFMVEQGGGITLTMTSTSVVFTAAAGAPGGADGMTQIKSGSGFAANSNLIAEATGETRITNNIGDGKLTMTGRYFDIPWRAGVAANIYASNGLNQIYSLVTDTNLSVIGLTSNSIPLLVRFTQDSTGGRGLTLTWVRDFFSTNQAQAVAIDTNANAMTEVSLWIANGVTNGAARMGEDILLTKLGLGTATSADLASRITDEEGSGKALFGNPTTDGQVYWRSNGVAQFSKIGLTNGSFYNVDILNQAAGQRLVAHSATVWTNAPAVIYDVVWLDAGMLISNVTVGTSFSTQEYGSPTNRMFDWQVFTDGTTNLCQASFPLPLDWDLQPVKFKFYWSTTNAIANQTNVWAVQATAISHDDPLDGDWGTEQIVKSKVTAANDLIVSDATPAVTVGGTPAAGDLVSIRVKRLGAHADDAMTDGQAKLRGLWLQYGRSGATNLIQW